MNNKLNTIVAITLLLLIVGGLSYVYTAPYAGNAGLSRTPGVRIGGTLTPAPDDFSTLNDQGTNLIMKLDGFPPFVVYLAYYGTEQGVITATRPDGGYWPQRVREGRNNGWLRIGDETFAMQATEVLGDEKLPMLELWSPRAIASRQAIAEAAGEEIPDLTGPNGAPLVLRNSEVFFWTPR